MLVLMLLLGWTLVSIGLASLKAAYGAARHEDVKTWEIAIPSFMFVLITVAGGYVLWVAATW